MKKLKLLAKIEGYESINEMLEDAAFNGVSPGICTNPDCDFTASVEPDCEDGYCEDCETYTVKSALILGGFI